MNEENNDENHSNGEGSPAQRCASFMGRLVACIKIQNAKNEGSEECEAWIAQDRERAVRLALNQVTAGIGIIVMAGVDLEALLTRWAEAVERRNADTSNAQEHSTPSKS